MPEGAPTSFTVCDACRYFAGHKVGYAQNTNNNNKKTIRRSNMARVTTKAPDDIIVRD